LIPNLIHDMKDPKQADRVCNWAYAISMTVYLIVSVVGYLMYGTNVSDEVSTPCCLSSPRSDDSQISKDLAKTPGFSPVLNKLAVWTVTLNPLTKIPLGLRPVRLLEKPRSIR